MKITKINLYRAPPRWLFLKIDTDGGYVGWGEPVIEGRTDVVFAAVNDLTYYLIGKDPMNIEDIWQTMYRAGFYRGGPEVMSAIAGIDQALWDIKGKYFGTPVYNLIGGACRDKIRVYRWIGGDRPSDVLDSAKLAASQGFTAIKMNATEEMHYIDSFEKIDAVCKRVEAIRDAFGYKMDIALDFHGRVHKPMAKVLAREIEKYHLMFIEEPVLSENLEALRDICNHTSTPVSTGERLFSRWDFKRILQEGYVDVIQPDLSHAGGISECKKIASMAEAFDVAVAPHCPLGPVALAACIQLDACTPNAFIQEQSAGIHYNAGSELFDYLADPTVYKYENGNVNLLRGPGLGVEINEEALIDAGRRAADWKNPVWRNSDGTIAEW